MANPRKKQAKIRPPPKKRQKQDDEAMDRDGEETGDGPGSVQGGAETSGSSLSWQQKGKWKANASNQGVFAVPSGGRLWRGLLRLADALDALAQFDPHTEQLEQESSATLASLDELSLSDRQTVQEWYSELLQHNPIDQARLIIEVDEDRIVVEEARSMQAARDNWVMRLGEREGLPDLIKADMAAATTAKRADEPFVYPSTGVPEDFSQLPGSKATMFGDWKNVVNSMEDGWAVSYAIALTPAWERRHKSWLGMSARALKNSADKLVVASEYAKNKGGSLEFVLFGDEDSQQDGMGVRQGQGTACFGRITFNGGNRGTGLEAYWTLDPKSDPPLSWEGLTRIWFDARDPTSRLWHFMSSTNDAFALMRSRGTLMLFVPSMVKLSGDPIDLENIDTSADFDEQQFREDEQRRLAATHANAVAQSKIKEGAPMTKGDSHYARQRRALYASALPPVENAEQLVEPPAGAIAERTEAEIEADTVGLSEMKEIQEKLRSEFSGERDQQPEVRKAKRTITAEIKDTFDWPEKNPNAVPTASCCSTEEVRRASLVCMEDRIAGLASTSTGTPSNQVTPSAAHSTPTASKNKRVRKGAAASDEDREEDASAEEENDREKIDITLRSVTQSFNDRLLAAIENSPASTWQDLSRQFKCTAVGLNQHYRAEAAVKTAQSRGPAVGSTKKQPWTVADSIVLVQEHESGTDFRDINLGNKTVTHLRTNYRNMTAPCSDEYTSSQAKQIVKVIEADPSITWPEVGKAIGKTSLSVQSKWYEMLTDGECDYPSWS
ncbi:hypothetical protein JCM10296v2_004407 [Rhodotorula toruloides]